MKIEKVNIGKVFINENNPRFIKDFKFQKLVNSIKEFPQMLQIRPIVVNEEMVVLGGNMRLKACEEAGLKEVFIIKASELTKEQQEEFIIKDNISFGEWDFDSLANNFEEVNLEKWGLDFIPNSESFNVDNHFENKDDNDLDKPNVIKLEYSQEEYDYVIKRFNEIGGSKEAIIYKLLNQK